MRNGDAYKIKNLATHGSSIEDIHAHFRGGYTLEEIDVFMPEVAKVEEPEVEAEVVEAVKPKPLAKRRKSPRKRTSNGTYAKAGGS